MLEALANASATVYYPIEISRKRRWRNAAKELGKFDCVSIDGLEQPYLEGLLSVAAGRRRGERLLVLFLGSTIGNFDRPAAERVPG